MTVAETNGGVEVVRVLVEAGADLNQAETRDCTGGHAVVHSCCKWQSGRGTGGGGEAALIFS